MTIKRIRKQMLNKRIKKLMARTADYETLSVDERVKTATQRVKDLNALPREKSVIYEIKRKKPGRVTEQVVINEDVVSVLFMVSKKAPKNNIAVLNFADFYMPGGLLRKGILSQEESLCWHSNLYNVLEDERDNYYLDNYTKQSWYSSKGFYDDRALFSKDVWFLAEEGDLFQANVISCSAPNRSLWMESVQNGSLSLLEADTINTKAITNRITLIKDICMENDITHIVLGAWGCGVFGQDPEMVARIFKEVFTNSGIACFYAIPNNNENYDAFYRVFAEERIVPPSNSVLKPLSREEIAAELSEARACYARGEYEDFDKALNEISKKYDL